MCAGIPWSQGGTKGGVTGGGLKVLARLLLCNGSRCSWREILLVMRLDTTNWCHIQRPEVPARFQPITAVRFVITDWSRKLQLRKNNTFRSKMGADETKQYRTVFFFVCLFLRVLFNFCSTRSARYLTGESLTSLWCSLASSNYFIIDVYLTKDKLGAAQLFHYRQLPQPTPNDARLIQSRKIYYRGRLYA